MSVLSTDRMSYRIFLHVINIFLNFNNDYLWENTCSFQMLTDLKLKHSIYQGKKSNNNIQNIHTHTHKGEEEKKNIKKWKRKINKKIFAFDNNQKEYHRNTIAYNLPSPQFGWLANIQWIIDIILLKPILMFNHFHSPMHTFQMG